MKKIFVLDLSDKRIQYVKKQLQLLGYTTFDIRDEKVDYSTYDSVNYVISPAYKADNPNFIKGSTVYAFLTKDITSYCEANDINLINIMDDEKFVYKNSVLTAEGSLAYAILNTDYMLCDQKILILGYGHLGKAEAKLFYKFNKDIVVATNNVQSKAIAEFNNIKHISISDAEKSLDEYDVIINTIPAKIFGENVKLKETALIIELASKVYPFNYEELEKRNIKYFILNALPSKTCPFSAGKLLLNRIIE